MRFFEVDSAVDAIMSAAMIAQNRASQRDKQGKLSMNGFLQMLANAGVVVDYEGFKTVFDTNPQLANVIAKFDKDSITFASADAEDEGAGYEEPQGDMPDDERVAKMAKRAMKTREFVEAKEIGVYKEIGGVRYYAVKNKSGKEKQFSGPTPAAKKYAMTEATLTEFDRHQDIIDQIVDMQPETSNEIIRMAQKLGAPDRAIDDILQAVLDRVNIDEATNIGINILNTMEQIVDQKSAMEVKFVDGKSKVDMYTASAFMQVYNKVNEANQKKMLKMAETRTGFVSLMKKVFNIISGVKEGKSPHKKGTAKYKKHMAAMHAGESVAEAWQAFKEGAPKMKYALVGTDMKIYSMGSDERDLRLDRKSLEKRFKDVAPLKMARLKTAQAIGDKVDKSQLKEEEEPNKPDSAKAVDQMRDDKKKTRIAQLQLQIAKASETINKLNSQEKPDA